jgi:hypothetical protein
MDFILSLARDNIQDIQIYIGEIVSLRDEFREISDQDIYLTDHILYAGVA